MEDDIKLKGKQKGTQWGEKRGDGWEKKTNHELMFHLNMNFWMLYICINIILTWMLRFICSNWSMVSTKYCWIEGLGNTTIPNLATHVYMCYWDLFLTGKNISVLLM